MQLRPRAEDEEDPLDTTALTPWSRPCRALVLVGRPVIDLVRTDSALCR